MRFSCDPLDPVSEAYPHLSPRSVWCTCTEITFVRDYVHEVSLYRIPYAKRGFGTTVPFLFNTLNPRALLKLACQHAQATVPRCPEPHTGWNFQATYCNIVDCDRNDILRANCGWRKRFVLVVLTRTKRERHRRNSRTPADSGTEGLETFLHPPGGRSWSRATRSQRGKDGYRQEARRAEGSTRREGWKRENVPSTESTAA